jgi:hypothetical protein
MSTEMRKVSSYTTKSTGTDLDGRPTSSDASKKPIWTTLLDGVSSGKRMPEKSLLVLGMQNVPPRDRHNANYVQVELPRHRKASSNLSRKTLPRAGGLQTVDVDLRSQTSSPWDTRI